MMHEFPWIATPSITSGQFLVGLKPGLPPDYFAREYNDYSIYTALQHRCVWELHTHDCTQITVALSPAQVRGEWHGTHGRVERRQMIGDMAWIVPPGIPHAIHFDRPATLVHLYLDESFFTKMVQDAPVYIETDIKPSVLVRDPLLVELARTLHRESVYGRLSPLFTESLATLTATHLVRTYSNSKFGIESIRGGMGLRREQRVLAYIDEHLHEAITLRDIADVAEVSPHYLITLFRQSTGMTPHKYLVQKRIERARILLHSKQSPISEVALQCGFHNHSQFARAFRSQVGVTPGQYRRLP